MSKFPILGVLRDFWSHPPFTFLQEHKKDDQLSKSTSIYKQISSYIWC